MSFVAFRRFICRMGLLRKFCLRFGNSLGYLGFMLGIEVGVLGWEVGVEVVFGGYICFLFCIWGG